MSSAVLRGRDHVKIGEVAAVAEGPAAVALSRGGARKQYAHTDPNEDAAGFAEGEGGVLLVVADGHSGHEAAELAVERLVAEHAPAWTGGAATQVGPRWGATCVGAIFDACAAIHRRAAAGGRGSARTTLSLVLVRPEEDLLAWASIGDSHAFVIGDERAEDLAGRPQGDLWFLGHPAETAESLRDKCLVGARSLTGVRGVALVTDGLSERGIGVERPSAAVQEAARRAEAEAGGAPDRIPLELARGIVEAALAAQRRNGAGDNVASSVTWLD